jgi:hypothetical protein
MIYMRLSFRLVAGFLCSCFILIAFRAEGYETFILFFEGQQTI